MAAGLPSACGGDSNSPAEHLEAYPYKPLRACHGLFPVFLFELDGRRLEAQVTTGPRQGHLPHEEGGDQGQDEDSASEDVDIVERVGKGKADGADDGRRQLGEQRWVEDGVGAARGQASSERRKVQVR